MNDHPTTPLRAEQDEQCQSTFGGCGAHVRAGAGEHAIALGDGSYVGFPTPCGKGRGCGNPLCTMSCIRRVSRTELLHWAGSSFEAAGGTLQLPKDATPPQKEAALRAVHLLGRDGSLLFEDDPALLARWATSGLGDQVLRHSIRAATRANKQLGWEPWDASTRAQAQNDLAWLLRHPPGSADRSSASPCPICAAPARQPYRVRGEPAAYEARALLRWLEGGVALHPSSGERIDDIESVLRILRPVVCPDTARRCEGPGATPKTDVLAVLGLGALLLGVLVRYHLSLPV